MATEGASDDTVPGMLADCILEFTCVVFTDLVVDMFA